MPQHTTGTARIPEHPQERQCIGGSYFNDAKGSVAHINGSVDPRYRQLFDVVTSQERFQSGLGIGGKTWLVALPNLLSRLPLEVLVIWDIVDKNCQKAWQKDE